MLNKNLKIYIIISSIFFEIFLFSNFSLAATYYVDQNHPQASDSNPGTENLPWKTIQKAANVIQAGDTVIVKSGTYNERVIFPSNLSGTSEAKITFKAEPRRTVTMNGFRTANVNYLKIEGFNITYSEAGSWLGGGIWLSSSYVEIVDNYFYDIPNPGIIPDWRNGVVHDNVYIAHNKFYKCNKGIVVSGKNWLVEDNEIERLVYYDEDADYFRFFGEGHIIRQNYMHGTKADEIGSSHTDGFQTFGVNGGCAKNIIVEGNFIKDYHAQSFMLEGEGCHDNIIIRNNILSDAGAWGVAAHGITNLKIYNNNFINIGLHGIGFRDATLSSGTTLSSTGEIKNNIFF